MNIPDKDTIIGRIKALLSLGDASRNPYEEEVKTALSMAQKLMKKYNLSMNDINIKETPDDSIKEKYTSRGGHLEPWKRNLAHVIQLLFDVEPIIHPITFHRRCWCFVGFEVDCKLAAYTYDYLESLIDFRSKLKYKGRRRQRQAYLQGFLECLLERATAEKAKRDTPEDIKYGSLVVAKNDRIKKWISENLKTKQEKRRGELDLESMLEYSQGYQDAKRIDLNNNKKIS